MRHLDFTGRYQYSLRSALAALVWLGLVIAVCVQHQRASARQREVMEHLMSVGFPPLRRASQSIASPPNAVPVVAPPVMQPSIDLELDWPAKGPS